VLLLCIFLGCDPDELPLIEENGENPVITIAWPPGIPVMYACVNGTLMGNSTNSCSLEEEGWLNEAPECV